MYVFKFNCFRIAFITVEEYIEGKLDIIKIASKQIVDKSNNIIILPLDIFPPNKTRISLSGSSKSGSPKNILTPQDIGGPYSSNSQIRLNNIHVIMLLADWRCCHYVIKRQNDTDFKSQSSF